MTALHWAAYHDWPANGGRPPRRWNQLKAVNRYGVTPLSLACTNGNAAMVELLLESARTPTRLCRAETLAPRHARAVGAPASVKALLSRGANVDSKDDWRGQHSAARGRPAWRKSSSQAGADFRARLASRSPIREGRIDVVKAPPRRAQSTQIVRLCTDAPCLRGGRMPRAVRALVACMKRHSAAGGSPAGRRRQSERGPHRLHRPSRRLAAVRKPGVGENHPVSALGNLSWAAQT